MKCQSHQYQKFRCGLLAEVTHTVTGAAFPSSVKKNGNGRAASLQQDSDMTCHADREITVEGPFDPFAMTAFE